jgi:hypothetical protein
MRFTSPRRIAVTVAFMIGSLSLGVAMAQWTTSGSGSGQAKALSAVNLVVTARAGTADLYPGFTQGDVYFTVTNPNPYPVRMTSATFGAVTSSNIPLCPSTNVTVAATASGLTLDIPAGSVGTNLSIADVVSMGLSAPDGCQGKDFTIAMTLSGSQQ